MSSQGFQDSNPHYGNNEGNSLFEQIDEQMAQQIQEEMNQQMTTPMYEEYQDQTSGMDADQTKFEMDQMGTTQGAHEQMDERTAMRQFPRQVMTALGPLPLPEEFKNNIPEKFVAKPIIEEREIYVSKKERKQREVQIPHVQYEHTFQNVRKQFRVSKLIPSVSEVIKEVPKEVLKPVIEEKIIEVPQGVKYVEVPVEVPCLYPPKIVPRVVTQYVERIVETVKPVVQEKIIEVPQTVIKQVPKVKTVEVPYYVPRYVEKIVEVPFRPNGEIPRIGSIPFNISQALPPLKPTHMFNRQHMGAMGMHQQMNIHPDGQMSHSDFQGQDMRMPSREAPDSNLPKRNSFLRQLPASGSFQPMPQMAPMGPGFNPNMFSSNGQYRESIVSQVENMAHRFNLPEGMQWGYPEGVTKPVLHGTNVPPLVVTCPPEIGRVTCARKDIQPDILTKGGVYEFEGFKKKGTAQALFPPLAPHNRVPFLPPPAAPGTPDIRTIEHH